MNRGALPSRHPSGRLRPVVKGDDRVAAPVQDVAGVVARADTEAVLVAVLAGKDRRRGGFSVATGEVVAEAAALTRVRPWLNGRR